MAAVLNVEVVSRESVVWQGEAKYVRARTAAGDIGVMAGHQPTLALLSEDGELVIDPVDGERKTARLHEGFLTVSNNRVVIAAKSADI
ncbi:MULTISPECIES: F0F1 ATP synthase subunit epsilon [Kocuria]|uniref:F0F1 ATP synthase subunit epsilon n=1 Tax=Kocuria TaxID=57493 RepID=UPI00065FB277|nr:MULTISPECIES: F0F1 ATP synthase subunit epsilon [Kocuria]MCT1368253.1 F0F1 ATP synthase subunit epsilon [Rothia sp. p3-SID1597]RUQ22396.1 F0F1 ATP synthase subunit epsilon [Kocuria sp. HSID16901]